MRIWPWSHINELKRANSNLNERLGRWEVQLSRQLEAHDNVSARILTQVSALTPGIGRIIAKLDPHMARSEFDPARKAESDKIADEVLKRLDAEAKAREPYNV